MSFIVRPALPGDLDALYRMAKSAGGGFTNLPADRPALKAKIERSVACFARQEDELADDLFLFVLEDTMNGGVFGTSQIFAKIGSTLPFYSYRIGTMTQHSKELNRTFRAELLSLCTDLDGASEVAGLFLQPDERSTGIGKLLARSRYLFIKLHRCRFADKTIAELRGAHDEVGSSPFWDGLAGRFFDMSFGEADAFNATHGNQFIADLMPKHPIYTALIPESARAAMGVPHLSGRAAMRMLEGESFVFDNYIDVFDGGPAMTVATDRIATVRQAQSATVQSIGKGGTAVTHLIAAGCLAEFRACLGQVIAVAGGIELDAQTMRLLLVAPSDAVTYVPV
jgi:arginine N-succinyltransferase